MERRTFFKQAAALAAGATLAGPAPAQSLGQWKPRVLYLSAPRFPRSFPCAVSVGGKITKFHEEGTVLVVDEVQWEPGVLLVRNDSPQSVQIHGVFGEDSDG
jgi:hypothetical protein